jgi:hypothetical protein
VVDVPGATGDWFGSWDGTAEPEADRYANSDATSGRMVDLIQRGEPAAMLCHWAGLYSNGTKRGFQQCKRVILALNNRFGQQTIWMKMSEVARYWAARELTRIEQSSGQLTLTAPVACPAFTIRVGATTQVRPELRYLNRPIPLAEANTAAALKPGTWLRQERSFTICFDLPYGSTELTA